MLIGRVKTPKAQKDHECFWCGETIPKREVYVTWSWKADDDTIEVIKTHTECKEAWESLPACDNEIWAGEFCRGCTCEAGSCRCDLITEEEAAQIKSLPALGRMPKRIPERDKS